MFELFAFQSFSVATFQILFFSYQGYTDTHAHTNKLTFAFTTILFLLLTPFQKFLEHPLKIFLYFSNKL